MTLFEFQENSLIEHKSNRTFDGVGAETKKSQASFQIFQDSSEQPENEPEISLPRPQLHH